VQNKKKNNPLIHTIPANIGAGISVGRAVAYSY